MSLSQVNISIQWFPWGTLLTQLCLELGSVYSLKRTQEHLATAFNSGTVVLAKKYSGDWQCQSTANRVSLHGSQILHLALLLSTKILTL